MKEQLIAFDGAEERAARGGREGAFQKSSEMNISERRGKKLLVL